jgi:hypothetical protein
MQERLQPAFWGGLFIGVLSALPIIGAANCCCCLWVLMGGALATYLRQQNTPVQVDAAEGAIMGLMAGAIGGVIWTVLGIPMQMLMAGMGLQDQWIDSVLNSNPDMPAEVRDVMERLSTGAVMGVLSFVVNLCASLLFGTLGGLLGVAIFKKNVPPPPPGTVEILPPSPPPPTPPAPPQI